MAATSAGGSRFACLNANNNKCPNFLLLLLFGFACTVFVAWHGFVVVLDSTVEYRSIRGRSYPESSASGQAAIVIRSDTDYENLPLNIDIQSQLEHSLPERLQSILSSSPFSRVPLLPLNVSVIAPLFDDTSSPPDIGASSDVVYAFGILPSDWSSLQDSVIKTSDSHHDGEHRRNCRLANVGTWCLVFRCLVQEDGGFVNVILSQLYNETNYWTIRACDSRERRMAFKMVDFTARPIPSSNITILLPNDLHLYTNLLLRHARFLPCDYRSAKAYRRAHYHSVSSKDTADRNRSTSTTSTEAVGVSGGSTSYIPLASIVHLAELRDLLHGLRMSPFVCGGTLLGWRRECGIIPYTSDFDFCVPIAQYNAGLEAALATNSHFTLKHRYGRPSDSLEYTVYDRNGVRMDIFFLYQNGNESWVGGMGPARMKLRYPYPAVTRLCSIDLLGHLFQAPCNVEEFLLADYGPNWTSPIHQNSYSWFSTHNSQQRGYWSEKEAAQVDKEF